MSGVRARSFGERTQDAQTLINIVTETLWKNEAVRKRLLHVRYGYETHIPPDVREKIRRSRNETARYIRFTPDFFVLDLENPENLYLLEYKCTRTPLCNPHRVSFLQRQAALLGMSGLEAHDVGQWEASAYDNYQALRSIGIRVAVLNYCAYHPRLLLCDFVDRAQVLYRSDVKTETLAGSRTPFVNLDLRTFRTLADFLTQEHSLEYPLNVVIRALCDRMMRELQRVLPATSCYLPLPPVAAKE